MRLKFPFTLFMLLACLSEPTLSGKAPAPTLRVATFRCDVTPPPGDILLWTVPLTKVEEPLLAKGIVFEAGRERYVICSLDWCILANSSDRLFRRKLAAAAGTDASRVAMHTIHQHAAPYADGDAHRLLERAPSPPPHLSDKFLEDVTNRVADALRQSLVQLQPFDQVGTGMARVDRVGSTRRIPGPDGKIIVRYSGGGKDPALAALPEGDIDPFIRTVTIARGTQPLVRLHYYATHPQTHCCDGAASADIVGIARERLEQHEKVFQIYFTGCGGDVTVGKYNDGTQVAWQGLTDRLFAGMQASAAATKLAPVRSLNWRVEKLNFPRRYDPGYTVEDNRARMNDVNADSGTRVYKGAMRVAFFERKSPVEITSLHLGDVFILHLPGEPMLEFQRFAQRARPDRFVAVAGYGDGGPAYLCPDNAYKEGGYEPTDSNVAPGSEALLKEAIRRLLKD